MQGPQRLDTANCAGPVRATRAGLLPIWPRALQWPHMDSTARVLRRLNADILHDVFWRLNADFLPGFHDGLMPIFCMVFMMVLCQLPAPVSVWFNTCFLHGFHDGLMPISSMVLWRLPARFL